MLTLFHTCAICGPAALGGLMIAIGYVLGLYWTKLPDEAFR